MIDVKMTARLLLAALLLMLVSLDTMALAVDEDFYTCVPGIKPNIGGEWIYCSRGERVVEYKVIVAADRQER